MQKLFIDIETYSKTPLTSGVYRYTEDPHFRILMAGWSLDGGPVRVALGADVYHIPGLYDSAVKKIAHNAAFERICFSRGLGSFLDPEDWHDTMAIAGELGYPQSLSKLAVALGADPKDAAGTRLINLFCKPARDGHRVLPDERPVEWEAFVAYCAQDVATLIDVHQRLGGWPTYTERQVYLADQRINDHGIPIDRELAVHAVTAAEENRILQETEVIRITGIENPGSQPQMLRWLQESGLVLEDLRAATISDLLAGDLTARQRRVLELRQDLALVAAKKYVSALASVSGDGRVRGGFRFFGAHTGRWTGRGLQLHNLPRAQLPTAADTDAAILDLKLGLGASSETLKMLVRAMFVGPFTVLDYAAIEARVIAWLADEAWALRAFRDGRDIYVETAARMGGLTRSQGKVAVLALGYNGGVGSLRAMGAEGADSHLQSMVDQWRRANPAIVNLWADMDAAFYHGGPVGKHLTVEVSGDTRRIRLPSGRAIGYHGCKFGFVDSPWGPRRVASFLDVKGFRTQTYGGRLCENSTQAVARDILAETLVRLHAEGYAVAGHVHDEVLIEGAHPLDAVRRVMTREPDWARGLPIDAAGFVCDRYRKG